MKTLTSHTQRTTAPPGNGHTSTPNSEGTTELLTLILDRLERMEQRFDHYEALVRQALPVAGIMTDTVDGWMAQLRQSGIDVDERTKETLRLLAELTAPQSMEALHTLIGVLPTLGVLLRQAPGALAAMVDTGDELVLRLRESGIDARVAEQRLRLDAAPARVRH
jgi:hypothetical protein